MDFEFKKQYEKVPVVHYPHQVPENPLVSVCVQTYQHAKYIRQCLDGILMQQTDFDFEILLGEDASMDGTREICLEYAQKYPEKIRLFLHHRENNISIEGKPTGRFNFIYNLYSSNGKYVAFCEGDDYWTDPFKLKKQINFLETNPSYPVCFHQNLKQIHDKIIHANDFFFERDREANEVLWGGILLNSVVFRKGVLNFSDLDGRFVEVNMADVYLLALLTKNGGAKFLPDIKPSIYRFHAGGIWSPMSPKRKIEKRIINYFQFDKVPKDHQSTYYFVIMNFYLDLIVVNVKAMEILAAIRAYVNAANYSLKSLAGVKWFLLFHVRLRYKNWIVKRVNG